MASKSGSDLKASAAALNNEKSSKEPIFCEQASDSVIDLVSDQLTALFVENETCKVTEETDVQVRYLRGKFSTGVYVRYITNLCEMLNVNLTIKFHALELFDLFMANHFSKATQVARRCFGEEWLRKWPNTLERIEDQMILRMISCIQIAAKIRLNEDSVRLSSLMYVLRRCKENFDTNSVLASELRVLKTVDFVINQKTPLDFVEILIEALGRNEPNLHTENLYRVAVDVVDVVYFVKAELYEKLRERLKRTAAAEASRSGTSAGETVRGSRATPRKDLRSQPPASDNYAVRSTPKNNYCRTSQDNDVKTSPNDFTAGKESFDGIFKTPQMMASKAKEKHRSGDQRTPKFTTKDSLFQAQSIIFKAKFKANKTQNAGVNETRRVKRSESLFTPVTMGSKTQVKRKRGRKIESASQPLSRESLFTPMISCKAEKRGQDCESLFSPAASSKTNNTKGKNGDDDEDEETNWSTSEMERKQSCVEAEKLWEMMEKDMMFMAAAVISSSAYILNRTEFVRVLDAVVDIVQLPFDNVVDFTVVLLEYLLMDN